ncbi:MAG: DUF937 domain-containing protein [Rhodomicrobium sp.]|jgi:hypothetical protein
MANLNEILENANGGEAIPILGQELGLTPEQTQSAITALLPAISSGLKQSTSSVDGLGNLFALMGQQKDLPGLFEDAKTALSPDGLAAGNQALSLIFGSQEASQAIVDQAQKFSGVSSSVLDKMLPALTGIAVSGLMRSGSPATAPLGGAQGALSPFGAGGGLGDILGQVFGRVLTGGAAPAPAPSSGGAGPLGDILGQIFGQGAGSGRATAPAPQSSPFPSPADTGGGQAAPGGDLLSMIFREVLKGIQNGSIKPVIIGGGGPIQIPTGAPGGQDGSGAQVPGGDIFGKILRDVLGGALGGGAAGGGSAQAPQMPQGGGAQMPQMPTQAPTQAPRGGPMGDLSDLTRQLGVMGGAGAAVFGDRLDHGQDVDQSHLDNIQGILDRQGR